MPYFNAHDNNRGFTLAETAVIAVVIGILAALAIPNFMRWLQNNRVEDALVNLQGALKEAQREAIRNSRTCTVFVPDGGDQTITANPTSCLVTSSRTLDRVAIASNLETNPKEIQFSFKGTTTSDGTIALSVPGDSGQKRCLAISSGLGIIRTGIYNGSINSPITDNNCTTSQ